MHVLAVTGLAWVVQLVLSGDLADPPLHPAELGPGSLLHQEFAHVPLVPARIATLVLFGGTDFPLGCECITRVGNQWYVSDLQGMKGKRERGHVFDRLMCAWLCGLSVCMWRDGRVEGWASGRGGGATGLP